MGQEIDSIIRAISRSSTSLPPPPPSQVRLRHDADAASVGVGDDDATNLAIRHGTLDGTQVGLRRTERDLIATDIGRH